MSEDGRSIPAASHPESGRVYTIVTRYWPRIAAGLVVLAAGADLVIGSLTADSGLEFYLLAWAAITGGLWFVFEKAETALGAESRSGVAVWLGDTGLGGRIESVPEQFALLFDRVFGEEHRSWQCFRASSTASVVVTATLLVLLLAHVGGDLPSGVFLRTALPLGLIALTNILPDYKSLLVTREIIDEMRAEGMSPRLLWKDFRKSLEIALGWAVLWWFVLSLTDQLADRGVIPSEAYLLTLAAFIASFFATLFTSAWLWLYAASVMTSRVLVRMGGGVGFLLRVTDVERQPFRSMGFVSVIMVSGLFVLLLPLVLL